MRLIYIYLSVYINNEECAASNSLLYIVSSILLNIKKVYKAHLIKLKICRKFENILQSTNRFIYVHNKEVL